MSGEEDAGVSDGFAVEFPAEGGVVGAVVGGLPHRFFDLGHVLGDVFGADDLEFAAEVDGVAGVDDAGADVGQGFEDSRVALPEGRVQTHVLH